MDTSLIGKAKELEVAGILVRNGLYVFFPLVDAGVDLVITNRAARKFIPVQVKYRASDPALGLTKQDITRFQNTETVVAFVIGNRSWFIPFQYWKDLSVDPNRADERVYVTISRNEDALAKFEGDAGAKLAFESLLK